jgi:hypothetical protein
MLAQFPWLLPVLVGAAVVFVVDLIGNMISFNNRFLNALVTALVFAVIFGVLMQTGILNVATTVVAPVTP